ncbi:hypothetical protein Zmor_006379 [Zophobas morio]|uniref:Uncharacterized protein n=1 Tax=Zophobas morio TaxID=2755281 RepID=A0AA38IUR2_9CUCU|nr:hypothetical protein Zmor_006379 [Zophobas morio]
MPASQAFDMPVSQAFDMPVSQAFDMPASQAVTHPSTSLNLPSSELLLARFVWVANPTGSGLHHLPVPSQVVFHLPATFSPVANNISDNSNIRLSGTACKSPGAKLT